jgi:hypothetical protein
MKPGGSQTLSSPRGERGAAMLAALCLAMVFAICLSSYVALCYTSLKTSTRNLMNLHCVELAETGLEQALYSQNNDDWTSQPWITSVPAHTATLTLPVTLPSPIENGETWQIKVQVSNYGYPNYGSTPLNIVSWGTVSLPDGTSVTRELQSSGSIAPTFVNAVAATAGNVTFRNTGQVKSYDSRLGPQGPSNTGYSAVVLSGRSPPSSFPSSTVNLRDATIFGYVVGTEKNSIMHSGGAVVVGLNSPSPAALDTSRLITNPLPYQPQFPETPIGVLQNFPYGTNLSSGNFTLGAGSYNISGDLTVSGNAQLTIDGPVILVVGGNLTVSSTGGIVVSNAKVGGGPTPGPPFAASLELHLAGSLNLTAEGIDNLTLIPKRVAVMGSTNNNLLSIGMSVPFYGTLYFPKATLDVGNNQVFYGSIVANAVKFNASPAVYYDVALRVPDVVVGDPSFTSFNSSSSATYIMQPISLGSVTETVPAGAPPF